MVTEAAREQVKEAVEQHYLRVRRSFALLLSDASMVEDLTQEVFTRFADAVTGQLEVINAWGFIRGIMRNVWREHMRIRRRWGPELPEDAAVAEEKPVESIEQEELLVRVRASLEKLEPEDRALILGKYFFEMTGQELAEHLQTPRRTLLDRLNRALRRIRKEVGLGAIGK